jgi:hypothetical protein
VLPLDGREASAGRSVYTLDDLSAFPALLQCTQSDSALLPPISDILIYSALLYLAKDKRSFVRQLDRALNENDPVLRARRIELARQNAWVSAWIASRRSCEK